jgi:hypothetical protein
MSLNLARPLWAKSSHPEQNKFSSDLRVELFKNIATMPTEDWVLLVRETHGIPSDTEHSH